MGSSFTSFKMKWYIPLWYPRQPSRKRLGILLCRRRETKASRGGYSLRWPAYRETPKRFNPVKYNVKAKRHNES